ncbi:MAG TPA: hypothetical protein VOA88_15020 [Candidatus Dormibacteraeota bacterium]|nr:hypothetical protein [Candidatus Dormibacteraeota bacterium]
MTPSSKPQIIPPANHLRNGICILYWSVGLVVLIESCLFVFSASRGHAFAKSGMPQLIRPILGGSEIIAALIFLIPPARTVGGYALLITFAVAGLIHILHGQLDVGGLIVYAAAVYTVLAAYKS